MTTFSWSLCISSLTMSTWSDFVNSPQSVGALGAAAALVVYSLYRTRVASFSLNSLPGPVRSTLDLFRAPILTFLLRIGVIELVVWQW